MNTALAARSSRASALALMIALATIACASAAERSPLVAEQAADRMQSLVRNTMRAAGGDWTSTSDGLAADPCTTPDGRGGVWFSWDQDADGPTDPSAVAHSVDRAWRSEGLATTTQNVKRADGETLYRVGASGSDVESIQFNATTSHMSINVQSRCGVGDLDDFTVDGRSR